MIRIRAIAGSLRSGSHTRSIIHCLAGLMPPEVDYGVVQIGDLPLYNEDIDTGDVTGGSAPFRAELVAAQGFVIATPEYNYGIPGVLKNALDWASRPQSAGLLRHKPVLTLSASPAATGGVRAQAQLNETLRGMGAAVLLRPQTVIPAVHQKIVNGQLSDAATLEFLRAGIADLLVAVRQLG